MGRQKKKKSRKKNGHSEESNKSKSNSTASTCTSSRQHSDSISSNASSMSEVSVEGSSKRAATDSDNNKAPTALGDQAMGAVGGAELVNPEPGKLEVESVKTSESGYNSNAESQEEKLQEARSRYGNFTSHIPKVSLDESSSRSSVDNLRENLNSDSEACLSRNEECDITITVNDPDSHELSTASYVTANDETPNISSGTMDDTLTEDVAESLPASSQGGQIDSSSTASESEMDTPRLLEHTNSQLAQLDVLLHSFESGSNLDTDCLLDSARIPISPVNLSASMPILPCPAGYEDVDKNISTNSEIVSVEYNFDKSPPDGITNSSMSGSRPLVPQTGSTNQPITDLISVESCNNSISNASSELREKHEILSHLVSSDKEIPCLSLEEDRYFTLPSPQRKIDQNCEESKLETSFQSEATLDQTNITEKSFDSTANLSNLAIFQNQIDLLKMNQARVQREMKHAKDTNRQDQETIASLYKTISALQDQLVESSNYAEDLKNSQKAQGESMANTEKETIESLHKTITMLQDQLVKGTAQPNQSMTNEDVNNNSRIQEANNCRGIHNSTLQALIDINRCISNAIAEDDTFTNTVSSELVLESDNIIDRENATAVDHLSESTFNVKTDTLSLGNKSHISSYSDYESDTIHQVVSDLLAQPHVLDLSAVQYSDLSLVPSEDILETAPGETSIITESEPEGPSKWQDLATSYLSCDPVVLRLQKSLASAVYYNDNLQGQLRKAALDVDKKMEEMNDAITEAREELQNAAKCNEELLLQTDGDQVEISVLKDELTTKEKALAKAEVDKQNLNTKLQETLSVKQQLEAAQSAIRSNQEQAKQLARAVSHLQRTEAVSDRPGNDLLRLLACTALLQQRASSDTQMSDKNADNGTGIRPLDSPAGSGSNLAVTGNTKDNTSSPIAKYREKLIQHALGNIAALNIMEPNTVKETEGISPVNLTNTNVAQYEADSQSIHDDIMKQSELVLTSLLLSGEATDSLLMLSNLANWQAVHKSIAEQLAEETQQKVQEELAKKAVNKTDTGTSPTRPLTPKSDNSKSKKKSTKKTKLNKTDYSKLQNDKEFKDLLERIRSELQTPKRNNETVNSTVLDSSASEDFESQNDSEVSETSSIYPSVTQSKEDSVLVEAGKRKKRLDLMLEAFTGKRADVLKENVTRPVEPEIVPQPEPYVLQESPTTRRRRKVQGVLDRYGLSSSGASKNDKSKLTQKKAIPSHDYTPRPYQMSVLAHKKPLPKATPNNVLELSIENHSPDCEEKIIRTSPIMERFKARLREKVDSFNESSSLDERTKPVSKRDTQKYHDNMKQNHTNTNKSSRTSSSLIKQYYTKSRREVYPHKNGYRPCYNTRGLDSYIDQNLVHDSHDKGADTDSDIKEPSSQESFMDGSFRTSSPVSSGLGSSYLDLNEPLGQLSYGASSTGKYKTNDNYEKNSKTNLDYESVPYADFSKSLPYNSRINVESKPKDKLSRSLVDLTSDPVEQVRSPKVTFKDDLPSQYHNSSPVSSNRRSGATGAHRSDSLMASKWNAMVNNRFDMFDEVSQRPSNRDSGKYRTSSYENYDSGVNYTRNLDMSSHNKVDERQRVNRHREVNNYSGNNMYYVNDNYADHRKNENDRVNTDKKYFKSVLSPDLSDKHGLNKPRASGDLKISESQKLLNEPDNFLQTKKQVEYGYNLLEHRDTLHGDISHQTNQANNRGCYHSVEMDKQNFCAPARNNEDEYNKRYANSPQNDHYRNRKDIRDPEHYNTVPGEDISTKIVDSPVVRGAQNTESKHLYHPSESKHLYHEHRRISRESVASDHSDATSTSSMDLIVTKSGDIWHRKKHSSEIKLRSPDTSYSKTRRVYQEGDSLKEISIDESFHNYGSEHNYPERSTMANKRENKKAEEISSHMTKDRARDTLPRQSKVNDQGHKLSQKIDQSLREYEGSILKPKDYIHKDSNNKETGMPSSESPVNKNLWHEHLLGNQDLLNHGKSTNISTTENSASKRTDRIESNSSSSFSGAKIFERLRKSTNKKPVFSTVSDDERHSPVMSRSDATENKFKTQEHSFQDKLEDYRNYNNNTVKKPTESHTASPKKVTDDNFRELDQSPAKRVDTETEASTGLPTLSEKQRMYADMLIDKYTTIVKQHPETLNSIRDVPIEDQEQCVQDAAEENPTSSSLASQIMEITMD